MKWALVPEREGRYLIPPLVMSYFDTVAGRYRTLKTTEAILSVSPGGRGDRAGAAPDRRGAARQAPARREVAELGNDILPVHAAIGRTASGLSALPGGAVFWLLLARAARGLCADARRRCASGDDRARLRARGA